MNYGEFKERKEGPYQPEESVSLDEAVLCENCRQITRAKNGHCPVCGSRAVVNLATLLDGKHARSI